MAGPGLILTKHPPLLPPVTQIVLLPCPSINRIQVGFVRRLLNPVPLIVRPSTEKQSVLVALSIDKRRALFLTATQNLLQVLCRIASSIHFWFRNVNPSSNGALLLRLVMARQSAVPSLISVILILRCLCWATCGLRNCRLSCRRPSIIGNLPIQRPVTNVSPPPLTDTQLLNLHQT